MSRKTAREVAMKLAYEKTFGSDDTYLSVLEQSGIEDTPDKQDIEFADTIAEGIVEHADEINNYISNAAVGWTIDRMPRVDVSILRIAVFELMFCKSTPYKVVINEAVRLSKRYGGGESPRFVNGVLSKIADTMGLLS